MGRVNLLPAVAALVTTGAAQAGVITFEDLDHGEIVTGVTVDGVSVGISALNPNRDHDLAIVFDSLRENTSDPDLEFPWARGNLAPSVLLGNLLIIAENDVDGDGDGLIDDPDDEGSRPAGSITLEFDTGVSAFGMDLIDVEGGIAENGSVQFLVNGGVVGELGFADFADPLSTVYDSTVAFGNNSANRLSPVAATAFGVTDVDEIRVHLGGSGAIDNLVFTAVPAPGAAAMMLAGLAGCGGRRRRV
jgi:hypothetical protein